MKNSTRTALTGIAAGAALLMNSQVLGETVKDKVEGLGKKGIAPEHNHVLSGEPIPNGGDEKNETWTWYCPRCGAYIHDKSPAHICKPAHSD